MKKWLVFVIVLSVFLLQVTSAAAADELTYERFDDWKNPYVAEGWRTHSVGGWGGEFNQIYEAAQEIFVPLSYTPSGLWGSLYRDFPATPGKYYVLRFGAGAWDSYFAEKSLRAWIQFDAEDGRVIKTHGPTSIFSLDDHYKIYGASNVVFTDLAPLGTHHLRVVLQVVDSGLGYAPPGAPSPPVIGLGGIIFTGVELYEGDKEYETYVPIMVQPFTKIAGPFLVRNTEWKNLFAPPIDWGFYTTAVGARYAIKARGGSAQGVSVGGDSFEEYKMVFRDFKVTPGIKYKTSVDVVSNSTNFLGTRDPSPVRVWVQYNDNRGNVLSIHGIDGTQAGVKSDTWTTVIIPGPKSERFTIAPPGVDHARIILQVMGGTGGGTIFDNVSFTRYEQ